MADRVPGVVRGAVLRIHLLPDLRFWRGTAVEPGPAGRRKRPPGGRRSGRTGTNATGRQAEQQRPQLTLIALTHLIQFCSVFSNY